MYPKRSWGIDASLPWLVSTLVIIGVAMLEELDMRRRYGEAYEAYRLSAPFLFPLPSFLKKLFALPFQVLFKRDHPERKREVAVVLSLYAALLIGASALFYGGGLRRTVAIFAPSVRAAEMERLAARLVDEPNWRAKYFIAGRLAAYGEPAVDYFIPLLQSEQADLRVIAAERLDEIASARAVPALARALDDTVADVRGRAAGALGGLGAREAVEPMLSLLDDPEMWVRTTAMRSLAELGAEEIVEPALPFLEDPEAWVRAATVESLGILGSERGLPSVSERLSDESASVRRSAVAALLKIGSPAACAPLRQATGDADWEVRVYAAEASKQLACR
jgi:hypothetical protein